MQTLKVNNQNLTVKEYKGNRVVTFKDIDTVHNRPEGTARKRFNDNRIHFMEGIDYYKITPSEFRTAIGKMDKRQQNQIILMTESGYLMLVKSFTDDLAWDVQRTLVNCYFRSAKVQSRLEQSYEFVMKYYNGEPVVTLKDIEFKTEIDGATLKWHIKKLKHGKEYFMLSGNELVKFKAENPKVYTKFISSLLVINEAEFIKLAKLIKRSRNCIEFVKLSAPKEKNVPDDELRVDIPDNPAIQEKMRDISQVITTLETVISLYNRYFTLKDKDHFSKVLLSIGYQIANDVHDLISMPVNLIKI